MPSKTIDLICPVCNSSFTKLLYKFNSNKKHNRQTLCSKKCVGIATAKKRYKDYNYKYKINGLDFTFFYTHTNNLERKKMDVDHLYQVWVNQKGVCPYTNIKLILPKANMDIKPYEQASLDRIDSNKGYVKSNIQFVSLMVNWAKNKYDEQIFKEFLHLIQISPIKF